MPSQYTDDLLTENFLKIEKAFDNLEEKTMAFHTPPVEERFPIAANSPRPTDEQLKIANLLQARTVSLAYAIDDAMPDGRWKSLALTSLEEALMWANKALFNEKREDTK